MMVPTPNCYFLACGSSDGFSLLNAFDNCLMKAGIGNTNLVHLSSIVPPAAQEVKPISLPLGALIPVAYAAKTSDHSGRTIAAAVAMAIPKDDSKAGLIMEFSDFTTKENAEAQVRKMAEEGLKFRNEPLKEIKSIATEWKIEKHGGVFACVVLWYK